MYKRMNKEEEKKTNRKKSAAVTLDETRCDAMRRSEEERNKIKSTGKIPCSS